MSVASSSMSEMSVNAFGEDDISFDDAVDRVYKETQQHLNDSHCSVRSLAMLGEQDGSYQDFVKMADDVMDHLDGVNDMFKQLKSVIAQCMPKPSNAEEKSWLQKHKAERKLEKIEAKEKLKREQQEARAKHLADVIEEEAK